MDPVTQGVLGAALPQATSKNSVVVAAGVFGFLSGMAADLDILIKSSTDPLLFLEYHRQFTHSLIFIPVGGFLSALVLYWLIGKRLKVTFKQSLLFCTLGYATHALLDACTTYGTMLFWPFSDERISWNTISIIDPLLTLPLLFLVLAAGIKKKNIFGRIAIVWAVLYMSLGMWQRDTAIQMGKLIAEKRGHVLVRIDAKPSFANILVWKIVYETSERFYVDAVRTAPYPRVFIGTSVAKLNLTKDFAWLDLNSQQAKDIERFSWFSNGYLAQDPQRSDQIIDIRYSLVPNDIKALWSIRVKSAAPKDTHVEYLTHRGKVSESFDKLWRMIYKN